MGALGGLAHGSLGSRVTSFPVHIEARSASHPSTARATAVITMRIDWAILPTREAVQARDTTGPRQSVRIR